MSPRRKRKRAPAAPVRKTTRRWRVPPPLTHGPEPLEGGTILEDLPEPLGIILWQTARDVSLWIATPPEERGDLFAAEAMANRRSALSRVGIPAQIEKPLSGLSAVLGDSADSGAIAAASASVSEWAEGEGLLGVALAYQQSVALIRDEDARTAYEVGVLARRRGEDARAETWYRRAVMLSRQSGDWTSYSLAFVGLGDLYVERENDQIARKLYVRARRAAARHSLHEIEKAALDGLAQVDARTPEAEPSESGRSRTRARR